MADNKTPVTDDQELAKVLASMNQQAEAQQQAAPMPAAQPASMPDPAQGTVPAAMPAPVEEDIPPIPATLPAAAPAPAPMAPPQDDTLTPSPSVGNFAASGNLEDIKRQALDELRPIVGKLDLPAEEKFDALLLVIRSSDDQSLISAAYEAAEGIADEAKKAQALLDIVKEIEYFSSQGK